MHIIKLTTLMSFSLLFFSSSTMVYAHPGFGGGGGFHGGRGGFGAYQGGGNAFHTGGFAGHSFHGFQGGGIHSARMPSAAGINNYGARRFVRGNSLNHHSFNPGGHFGHSYSNLGRNFTMSHRMPSLASVQNFHRHHENYGIGRSFYRNRNGLSTYSNLGAIRSLRNSGFPRTFNSHFAGMNGLHHPYLGAIPRGIGNRSLGLGSGGLNGWHRGVTPGLWGRGLGGGVWSRGNWGWNRNWNPSISNYGYANPIQNNNWYRSGGWGCGWNWGWGCNQWRWGWNAPFYPITYNYYHFYGYPLYPYSYFPYYYPYYGYPLFGFGTYFPNVYTTNNIVYDSGYLAAPIFVQPEKSTAKWVRSSNGKVPENAVVNEKRNNKTIYYCRASYQHQLYKGILVAKDGCYCTPGKGVTIRFNTYQVLVRA